MRLRWRAWRHRWAGRAKILWGRLARDPLLRIEGGEQVRLGRLEQRLARTLRRS